MEPDGPQRHTTRGPLDATRCKSGNARMAAVRIDLNYTAGPRGLEFQTVDALTRTTSRKRLLGVAACFSKLSFADANRHNHLAGPNLSEASPENSSQHVQKRTRKGHDFEDRYKTRACYPKSQKPRSHRPVSLSRTARGREGQSAKAAHGSSVEVDAGVDARDAGPEA